MGEYALKVTWRPAQSRPIVAFSDLLSDHDATDAAAVGFVEVY